MTGQHLPVSRQGGITIFLLLALRRLWFTAAIAIEPAEPAASDVNLNAHSSHDTTNENDQLGVLAHQEFTQGTLTQLIKNIWSA